MSSGPRVQAIGSFSVELDPQDWLRGLSAAPQGLALVGPKAGYDCDWTGHTMARVDDLAEARVELTKTEIHAPCGVF